MSIQDEANAPELSSADEIRADVTAAVGQLRGDAPDTSALTSDPIAGAEREPAPTPPADGTRARDEHGRFAPKVEAADKVQPPAAVSDADPAPANIDPPSTVVEAPKSWSADAKAAFATLAPAVQQAVIKRESEINDGGARWSEEKRTYETALAPVRELSQRYNVPPAETIKRLSAANEYLERDPGNAIRWLAQSYGVDLSALAATPQTPQPQADPVVAELQTKVSRFEQMLEQQQQVEVNSTLAQFAAAPGHEHFDAVKQDMGYLMLTAQAAGRAISMDQAYEQAVWANADTRAKMIASQTANADAARRTREATDKARRGAISVNGSPAGGSAVIPKSDPNASVVDDVRAAVAQLRH